MLAEAGVRVLGVKRVEQQGVARPRRPRPERLVELRGDVHLFREPMALHRHLLDRWLFVFNYFALQSVSTKRGRDEGPAASSD